MADLKTDYKDDVLDTTQNTKRKYQMIDNGDGTVSFEDVTKYLQQGDSFGADDINDTNEEVNIINDNLSVRYNEETDYLQVKYNGVWTNAIYIGKKLDPTKITLTQEEFIAICNQGLQSMMTVGAIVTLNNEKCSQYEVIDVNHDSTNGTVDLMAHTQVGQMRFDGSSQDYNVSEIRTWLNSNYHDLFDLEIRNLMQPMTVVTKGLTQQDKIKLLSWRELGLQYDSNFMDSTDGGEQYPVFTAGAYKTAVPDRWRAAGNYGNSSYYWLRSRYIGDITVVWRVNSGGTCDYGTVTNSSRGVLPVLRF